MSDGCLEKDPGGDLSRRASISDGSKMSQHKGPSTLESS